MGTVTLSLNSTLGSADLATAIQTLIQANQPFMVWGDPGLGKSQIVTQVADRMFAAEYGYHICPDGRVRHDVSGQYLSGPTAKRPWLIDFRAVLRDPTDLLGFPYVDQKAKRTEWALPAWLPTTGRGLIFFDEINRASKLMQNACLQLVQDRRIGENYEMPAGWAVGAAGNYESEVGVERMSDALSSRFTHMMTAADPDGFLRYAERVGFHPAVLAFVKQFPHLLHVYDRKKDRGVKGFPCNRTWEFVSRILFAAATPLIEFNLIGGTVGQGTAVDFVAFLKLYRELPDLDQIIATPTKAAIPTQPSLLYAVGMALARKATVNNARNVLVYLSRMPEQEYAAMAVRAMTERDAALNSVGAVTAWKVAHADVLI